MHTIHPYGRLLALRRSLGDTLDLHIVELAVGSERLASLTIEVAGIHGDTADTLDGAAEERLQTLLVIVHTAHLGAEGVDVYALTIGIVGLARKRGQIEPASAAVAIDENESTLVGRTRVRVEHLDILVGICSKLLLGRERNGFTVSDTIAGETDVNVLKSVDTDELRLPTCLIEDSRDVVNINHLQ